MFRTDCDCGTSVGLVRTRRGREKMETKENLVLPYTSQLSSSTLVSLIYREHTYSHILRAWSQGTGGGRAPVSWPTTNPSVPCGLCQEELTAPDSPSGRWSRRKAFT